MKSVRSRICLCCEQFFEADRRNARHQKYCLEPACRKASKAASQRRWMDKPENKNYHIGPEAVARVRAWQDAHPDYRERQKAKRGRALQDFIPTQVPEFKQETALFPHCATPSVEANSSALQDFIITQPPVFIGLISHFFNLTLQDDIASITRSLQKLGEDIANGRSPDECEETGDLFRTRTADAGAVQLGGSASGAG